MFDFWSGPENQTYSVASDPTVTGSIFGKLFIFLGQCRRFFVEIWLGVDGGEWSRLINIYLGEGGGGDETAQPRYWIGKI